MQCGRDNKWWQSKDMLASSEEMGCELSWKLDSSSDGLSVRQDTQGWGHKKCTPKQLWKKWQWSISSWPFPMNFLEATWVRTSPEEAQNIDYSLHSYSGLSCVACCFLWHMFWDANGFSISNESLNWCSFQTHCSKWPQNEKCTILASWCCIGQLLQQKDTENTRQKCLMTTWPLITDMFGANSSHTKNSMLETNGGCNFECMSIKLTKSMCH